MADFPPPEMIQTNGIRMAVHAMGPTPAEADKPAVVFLHGWPELAYSWRYQLPALAEAGYPAIAPDQRGYGGTDKPAGAENYDFAHLAGDLAGLLDARGIDKAVFVGHDWGATLLWALPFYLPERLAGLAGLNVPFFPRGPVDPLELFRNAFGDSYYICRFQQEGACEPVLERDVERTLRMLMRRPRSDKAAADRRPITKFDGDLITLLEGDSDRWPGEEFLSDEDLAVYVRAFSRGGFTGPLHWYRNFTRNWHDIERFQPAGGPPPSIAVPTLMMTAELDAFVPPRLADGMERYFTDYERVDVKGAGHWLQQEKAGEVNAVLLDWLARHFS